MKKARKKPVKCRYCDWVMSPGRLEYHIAYRHWAEEQKRVDEVFKIREEARAKEEAIKER